MSASAKQLQTDAMMAMNSMTDGDSGGGGSQMQSSSIGSREGGVRSHAGNDKSDVSSTASDAMSAVADALMREKVKR